MHTVVVEEYEYHDTPFPLGRKKLFDSRSLAYPVQQPGIRHTVVDKEWFRHIPPLDQGNIRSCEGNAETGCIATEPLWSALSPEQQAHIGTPNMAEIIAVDLYSDATIIDPYPGFYKPGEPGSQDTGTDGTSVSKAAKNDGWISGYLNATSLDGVLQALMTGPANLGVDWYENWFQCPESGILDIAKYAGIAGGHAIEAFRVDVNRQLVWCYQSWGTWGINGTFAFPWNVLDQLMAQNGDCVKPIPVNVEPPPPTPIPPTRDQVFASDSRMIAWAQRNRKNYPARTYLDWRAGVIGDKP